jgi:hypothetical protein
MTDISIERHNGRQLAIAMIVGAASTPASYYDARGAVRTVADNLQRSAEHYPPLYAAGIRDVLAMLESRHER